MDECESMNAMCNNCEIVYTPFGKAVSIYAVTHREKSVCLCFCYIVFVGVVTHSL